MKTPPEPIYMSKNSFSDSFFIGTSGLVLPFNKTQFPLEFRDKSRLQYYASIFNSIEFNNTFYKLPKSSTILKWAESVPQDFKFTFKVPKSITHASELKFQEKDVINFLHEVAHVGPKKGCLLLQFPPSLTSEYLKPLKELLQIFVGDPKISSWKLVVEFRHPSWEQSDTYPMLRDYNAAMVMHDMKPSIIQETPLTSDFVYLRLHGPEPRYRGSYSEEFLKNLAQSIGEWIEEGKTVYAYFNNTVGEAYNNAQLLDEFVKGSVLQKRKK